MSAKNFLRKGNTAASNPLGTLCDQLPSQLNSKIQLTAPRIFGENKLAMTWSNKPVKVEYYVHNII